MSAPEAPRPPGRTPKWWWVAAGGAGVLLRAGSYLISSNTGGDALARAGLAAEWLHHPNLQLSIDTYPPGHFWLIAALALLLRNVVTAGRVLSLVLGLGSLFLVARLARVLYGDAAALLSLTVCSFYTMHVAYSTTSSSEVPCVFFLLLALLLFFTALSRGAGTVWLSAGAGLSLSVAESIRYEAWILFAGMGAILLLSLFWERFPGPPRAADRFRALAAFGLTGGLWPAVSMAWCWRWFGNPLYLVTANRLRVEHTLATMPSSMAYQLALMPGVVAVSLSPLLFMAALYGLARSFNAMLTGAFASLIVLFGLVQFCQIVRAGLLALARYTLIPGTLLAVVAGFGAAELCRRYGAMRFRWAAGIVAACMAANLIAVFVLSERPNGLGDKLASVSPVLRYPRRVIGVARYLRTHLGPREAVVIDNYNVESNILAYAAGLPLLPGRRAYLASVDYPFTVQQYIAEAHPKYLVYSDLGTLRADIPLPSACDGRETVRDGVGFRCVFSSSIYRVYEARYP